MQVRFLIVFFIIISSIVTIYTRMCLNLAIISMTYPSVSTENTTVHEICPIPETTDDDDDCDHVTPVHQSMNQSDVIAEYMHPMDILSHLRHKKYHWSQSVQGKLLGSFSWSYMLFQVATGLIAQKFGGRWMISACLLFSGIISVVTPFVADYVWFFILLRVLLGVVQAGLFPAAFQTVCQWIPINERSMTFALIEFSAFGGAIIAFSSSGLVYKIYGWPAQFILPGLMAVVLSVFIVIFFRNDPNDSSLVSEKELKLIRQDIELLSNSAPKSLSDTPFRKIMFSKAVLAAAFFKFQAFWNTLIMTTKMPSYLSSIIHVDISTNGQINAMVCLINGVMLALSGLLSQKVIMKGHLSRTNTRKAFSLISGVLNGLCIFMVPYAGCNIILIRLVLFSQAICSGFTAASDVPLAAEMTKNYPAFTYSYINMLVMTAGFLAPWLSGLVLDVFADKWVAWSFIFQYSTGQSLVATLIFMLLASADRQEFDMTEEELDIIRQVSENRMRKVSRSASIRSAISQVTIEDVATDFKAQVARRASVVSMIG